MKLTPITETKPTGLVYLAKDAEMYDGVFEWSGKHKKWLTKRPTAMGWSTCYLDAVPTHYAPVTA